MHNSPVIPTAARWLGYGGLIPFVGLAASFAFDGPLFSGFALQAFLVYSATILAFVGGVRWGAALNCESGLGRELSLSVLPSLVAAGALLLPTPDLSVMVLGLGLTAFGALDWLLPYPGGPAWMPRLRLHLTAVAVVCHVGLWLAL